MRVPFVLGLHSVWALLMGQQRFRDLNVVRLAQPLIYAGVSSCWHAANSFTVTAVLLVQVGSYAVVLLVAAAWLVRSAWAWPARQRRCPSARWATDFGSRAWHSANCSRRDWTSSCFRHSSRRQALGYYSVAVSVASMVAVLFGSLSMVIFPVAASADREHAADVVERGVRLTFFGGGASVIALALCAPVLIPLVYGNQFAAAVPALWLLLPGIVLWSASSVLGSGLQAANRPGLASVAQLARWW